MTAILSGDTNLDFFIKGLNKFEIGGQTLYFTTTQICFSKIFVVLLVF